MIIKKFQAYTEKDAITMAKDEMGKDAIVLNIKTAKQRGLGRLFKKDFVEVTAALEEKPVVPEKQLKVAGVEGDFGQGSSLFSESAKEKSDVIEEKLNNLQNMLESQMKNDKQDNFENEKSNEKNVNFAFMQLIYSKMLDNEVDEKYANQIIGDIEASLKKESNVDTILSGVYQKIILKLGQPYSIDETGKTKLIFFVGPTGVGKTTTIAKLASNFKLNKKSKVAMITSDTFRIAAVEQLRTYANILDIPLSVVYTIDELNTAIKSFKEYDLIFVDTAGRSHKNSEQCEEIFHFINDVDVDEENIEKEVFLVLSAATKYKDLVKIAEVYKDLESYNLIFTKLDETTCLGNILNIKLNTNSSLSYITSGQVVPDDISMVDAQKIAKHILGGGE